MNPHDPLPPTAFPIEDGSAVIGHDGWDVGEWQRSLSLAPHLTERIAAQRATLDTSEALARDLFWSFLKRAPRPDPPVPLTAAHELNRALVEQALATREWQAVRAAGTVGDPLLAAMATAGLSEALVRALPAETRERANQLHALEREAAELFAQAEALEELAAQATGDRGAALFAQAEAARTRASAAQEEAHSESEALAAALPAAGDGVRRAARQELARTESELDEVGAMVATFGGQGAGSALGGPTLPVAEKVALARQVGRSPKLRQIAALCGRLTRIALRVQATKIERQPDEIASVTTGRDLARLLPAEMALLADEALEPLFLLRYAEGTLAQYRLEGRERLGQGPIIVALDGSGSMGGALGGPTKEAWAKAVMLALVAIARRQRRDIAVLHFSGAGELATFHFPKGEGTPAQFVACAEHFFGGGTDFEPWMAAALELVDGSRYDRADIICLSDGLASISPAAQAAWQERRRARGMRAYGVLLGSDDGAGTLGALVDALMRLDDLSEDEAVLGTLFAV